MGRDDDGFPTVGRNDDGFPTAGRNEDNNLDLRVNDNGNEQVTYFNLPHFLFSSVRV